MSSARLESFSWHQTQAKISEVGGTSFNLVEYDDGDDDDEDIDVGVVDDDAGDDDADGETCHGAAVSKGRLRGEDEAEPGLLPLSDCWASSDMRWRVERA